MLMAEKEPIYFLSQKEDVSGKSLSVFHAPQIKGFVIPSEVLRLRSEEDQPVGSLWRLVIGLSDKLDFEDSFEPSTVEKIIKALDIFLREEPADIIEIAENAPVEIVSAISSVQDNIHKEMFKRYVNLLGLQLPPDPEEDDRPYPAQYL